MKTFSAFLLACLLGVNFLTAAPAVPAAATPENTVRAFYTYRIKSGLTGAPTAPQLLALRQWLTPQLCDRLEKAAKERDAFIKKHGHSQKPPWVEGDLFSSTFEGPTSFEIAGGAGDAKNARVQVIFTYREPGQKDFRWADRVALKSIGGQWLIEDIIYDLPLEFGNSRTLRSNLP